MKYRVDFDPNDALPAAERKALAELERAYLRDNCYGSRRIRKATGWFQVRVTKTEIRVKRTRESKWEWMPTPPAIAKMIKVHDEGGPLKSMTVIIDDDELQPHPQPVRHDLLPDGTPRPRPSGKRHDVKPDGTPHARKPRKATGRRNKSSREGFTHPNVATA